ncbi:MAG: DUF1622 domain-containing protein [Bacteroidales bacterium]|nr:DUF1622 domain-containing protein [Bacteroidales bacterium]MCF8388110.1 DUF1622 domain-containing protein [Bacteroidales bacterium]MCF8398708.1 DUF1622 domain-containing protein [Bacteroidales bacterium]
MDHISKYIEYVAKIIEAAGVLIIAGGSIFVLIRSLFHFGKGLSMEYREIRQNLGRIILLGLEILVAGDIIATVSTEPTMQSVLVLAVIVLIRTFLSFSLQVELEGKLPWQKK